MISYALLLVVCFKLHVIYDILYCMCTLLLLVSSLLLVIRRRRRRGRGRGGGGGGGGGNVRITTILIIIAIIISARNTIISISVLVIVNIILATTIIITMIVIIVVTIFRTYVNSPHEQMLGRQTRFCKETGRLASTQRGRERERERERAKAMCILYIYIYTHTHIEIEGISTHYSKNPWIPVGLDRRHRFSRDYGLILISTMVQTPEPHILKPSLASPHLQFPRVFRAKI